MGATWEMPLLLLWQEQPTSEWHVASLLGILRNCLSWALVNHNFPTIQLKLAGKNDLLFHSLDYMLGPIPGH